MTAKLTDDCRESLLETAQEIVAELQKDDWEGCAIREGVMRLQSILDSDDYEQPLTSSLPIQGIHIERRY